MERYQFLRWGQTAFDQLQGRAAGDRHRAPGQHRVPRPRRVRPRRRGLPGHAGRHRLAHDDGQRPGRARLGRRRHRGRGRDARAAGVDAHPAGGRLQARRRAARGRDGHRPGPDHHRDAARARGRREVRGVLRRGRVGRAAGQPRHHRQHEPGVRLHGRDLPHRRRDRALPAHDRPRRAAGRAGRGLREGAGALARRGGRAALLRDDRARPRHGRPVDRRAEAPAGPGGALRRQGRLPQRAGRLRAARRAPALRGGRGVRGVVPRQRRPGVPRQRTAPEHRTTRPTTARSGGRPTRRRSAWTARSSRSTTATSSSPPSPRAPTRRTRRS